MDKRIRDYEEPAIEEIRQIIAELKETVLEDNENSVYEKIDKELSEVKESYMSLFKVADPPIIVIAYLEDKPIGGLLLFIQNPKKLEINPWQLGGHPWVVFRYNKKEIISTLLKKSIKVAKRNGFEQIHLSISNNQVSDAKIYHKLYEANGYKFHHETVGYSIDITGREPQEVVIPPGFEIQQISEVNREHLFTCLHETLNENRPFFFYDQPLDFRREFFFHSFCKMDSMVEESSVALLHEKKIVGFTFVLAFGESFLFLDWIGIHPNYRRQGLGTLLLRFIMNQAQNRRVNAMGLACESDNEIALKMYEKNHWTRTDHDVTYAWKKAKIK